MQITIAPRKKDYIHFAFRTILKQRRVYGVFFLILLSLLTMSGIMMFIKDIEHSRHNWVIALETHSLYAAIGTITWYIIDVLKILFTSPQRSNLLSSCYLELDENGIFAQQHNHEAHIEWHEVSSIHKSGNNMFITNKAAITPLINARHFDTEAEFNLFYQEVLHFWIDSRKKAA